MFSLYLYQSKERWHQAKQHTPKLTPCYSVFIHRCQEPAYNANCDLLPTRYTVEGSRAKKQVHC